MVLLQRHFTHGLPGGLDITGDRVDSPRSELCYGWALLGAPRPTQHTQYKYITYVLLAWFCVPHSACHIVCADDGGGSHTTAGIPRKLNCGIPEAPH